MIGMDILLSSGFHTNYFCYLVGVGGRGGGGGER